MDRLTLVALLLAMALAASPTEAQQLAVTSPAQQTSYPLVVRGTVTGTPDTSVHIDGVTARVDIDHAGTAEDPFQWVVELPYLEPGQAMLEVAAKDGLGGTVTTSQSINYRPQAGEFSLVAHLSSGIAPFNAVFEVDSHLPPDSTLRIAYEGEGDGKIVNGTTLRHTYQRPGIYEARLFAGDRSTRALIVVHSFAAIDLVVQARWNELADALMATDIEAALRVFANGPSRRKYRDAFVELRDELPRIGREMKEVIPRKIFMSGAYADYLVTRCEDGQTMGHHLTMLRDANGIWRIADL